MCAPEALDKVKSSASRSLNNLFICPNAASQRCGTINITLTTACDNCSRISGVNSIQPSFPNMVNGEIMWNLSNSPEEGQIELVHATHSKFIASKLNPPELHYISNVSAINHPTKAGTQKHSISRDRGPASHSSSSCSHRPVSKRNSAHTSYPSISVPHRVTS